MFLFFFFPLSSSLCFLGFCFVLFQGISWMCSGSLAQNVTSLWTWFGGSYLSVFLLPEIWQYQFVSLAWILKSADAPVLSVYLSPSVHLGPVKPCQSCWKWAHKKLHLYNSAGKEEGSEKKKKKKQSLALNHPVRQLPIVNQPQHMLPPAQWAMSWVSEGRLWVTVACKKAK